MIIRFLLRGGGLGAKFLLVIAIGKFLGMPAMATYGLTVAISVIASKVLGLGFSFEVNRLVSSGECGMEIPFRSLTICAIVAVCVSVAAVALTPYFSFTLDRQSAAIIAATVITEYISFEVNTLVFSAHRSSLGAVLMFLKTGVWAGVAVLGLWLKLIYSIEQVLILWMLCNLAVLFWGMIVLIRFLPIKSGSGRIIGVLKRGFPFYVASIFISLAQYVDRFVVARYSNPYELGGYIYAWQIANVVQTLTYAVVTTVAIPSLAASAREMLSKGSVFTNLFCSKWMFVNIVVSSSVLLLLMGFYFLSSHYGEGRIRLPELQILIVLGVSFIVRSMSDVLFGGLIASGNRLPAIFSSGVGLIFSIIIYIVFTSRYGVAGAAIANLVAAAFAVLSVYFSLKFFISDPAIERRDV